MESGTNAAKPQAEEEATCTRRVGVLNGGLRIPPYGVQRAAHNRDGHVKNFAFILDDATGDWSLTPAYDLLYTPGHGGEHTMSLAGESKNPGRSHMLRLAEQAGVYWRNFLLEMGELPGTI